MLNFDKIMCIIMLKFAPCLAVHSRVENVLMEDWKRAFYNLGYHHHFKNNLYQSRNLVGVFVFTNL